MTVRAPAARAWVMAVVIPRSLNDPVGFTPSHLSQTSQPVRLDRYGACTSGVPPSPRVTTSAASSNGRRSRYSAMTPRQGWATASVPLHPHDTDDGLDDLELGQRLHG